MKTLAPIVLYTYNRFDHTERTIAALKKNTLAFESDLIIFSDGYQNEFDKLKVLKVREYIKNISGFKSLRIIERNENYGLAKSIVSGVSEVLKSYDKIIVLEDDLITHPQFLEYMNTALDLYKESKDVFSITGFSHLKANSESKVNETCFLKITSTWSWATWADKWFFFNDKIEHSEILINNRKLRKAFNYDNSYPYYKMLKNRYNGKIKSWGIIWYWNVFKNNGLTLYPSKTLVDQIGFDGSGQNARNYNMEDNNIKDTIYEFNFPVKIEETKQDRLKVVKTLKKRKVTIVIKIVKQKIRIFFYA